MKVGTKIEAELTHKRFGRAVDVTASIRPGAGDRTDIDYVAAITLNHTRQNGAGHIHQPFVIGVNHVFPVFNVGFMRGLQSQRQPGIIDENINRLPVCRQSGNQLFNGCTVAHVQLGGIKVLAQLIFKRFQAFFATPGGNHFVTVSDKTASNAFTKTRCCSGNQDNHLTVPQRFLCLHTIARDPGDG